MTYYDVQTPRDSAILHSSQAQLNPGCVLHLT